MPHHPGSGPSLNSQAGNGGPDQRLEFGQVPPASQDIMATAVEDELIPRNPCVMKGAGVERPDERPVATVEQIAGLTRRDLELPAGLVRVRKQLQELTDGRLVYGPPKTASAVRSVAIPPPVLVGARQRTRSSSPLPTVPSSVGPTSREVSGTRLAGPWDSMGSASTICATPATRWPPPLGPARGS